ncbi:succinate dehydrogenase, hydrophobic membrane anchor protein [Candidatus Endoriftia persephonae]|jgi:succinate dehydrogenase / fumarate reductase membrane anchor subunit|nr:succinate dehydrogenase, hydrophobic membrane anchor protein [Candidatus Endoriftia persephone]USF89061.1 succinate dehydrogenase, hydrophobic membrane anchor protein [Candidatus Endoriftia persephone]
MSRQMPGLQAWLFQRISAVYLGLYTPLLLLYFIVMPPQSYAEWHVFLASPWVNSSILLFALALLVHAWVGVRDVVLDYVHPYLLRLAMLTGVAVMLIAWGFWVLRILLVVTA